MWYIYIIKCADGSLYTGATTDVKRRFKQHKQGKGGSYTASHKAVALLHQESFKTRGQALRREAEIKKFTRSNKLKLFIK
ncbi:MAG: endonuclease [Candidatus Terrybacteria bacterium RIFCSPLOWO2_01_FULL_40_23]|uniref:Endonuclease n=1 Tax=Candidatus Terrybacteria bacterium RIFCSPLOWO2_01_FULL_40_23 TaxID=1802366 RepID=A0A1G2PUZ7_9BACT|nr:MAG: endonuclease [Candidatus Terrybacteria bacterium RIFCSPLOWO2_01_FULL_40_23]